jgi:hypothetical protein
MAGRQRKRASDLRRGDVVELPSGAAEVVGQPFLGRRGVAPFDEQALFIRARIQPLAGDYAGVYETWDVREWVEVSTGNGDR